MTFTNWLKQQKHRQDIVGDLARDAVEDETGPKGNAGYHVWERHLESKGAVQGALDALAEAWREFKGERG